MTATKRTEALWAELDRIKEELEKMKKERRRLKMTKAVYYSHLKENFNRAYETYQESEYVKNWQDVVMTMAAELRDKEDYRNNLETL